MRFHAFFPVSYRRPTVLIAGLTFALLGSVLVSSAQDAAKSIWNGAFTADQAAKGEDAFEDNCAGCHGSDLHATGDAVDLTGPSFNASWAGKSLGERFKVISTSMPQGNPGSLNEEQYLDILAYILKFNGFPTGSQKLTADNANSIVITPKAN